MGATAGPKLAAKRFHEAYLRGAKVHYLLDLTWAGRVFHLSRESVEVVSSVSGETLQYEGRLDQEIAWEEAISLFSAGGDIASVIVNAVLPVDVALLVAQGHDLLSATGELSLWIDGTTYEDRRVILRGRLNDPEYGYVDEPLNASLQSEFFEDRGLIPPANQIITTTTWPNAAENAIGASYPFVFGQIPSGLSLSRAYLVDTVGQLILVAGHHTVAGSVGVSTAGASATLTAVPGVDGLGNAVTTVDVSTMVYTADDEFMVSWIDGAYAANNQQPLAGAGDVLAYLLSQTTLEVDWGRTLVAKDYLNRFQLAGCILEGVTPFEFITANLCPILPMSLVLGPYGLYPVPWRYDATQRDVVERLDTGIDPFLALDGPVAYEGSIRDLVNSFKLKYALRVRTGVTTKAVTLSGARTAGDTNSAESIVCRQSQLRYGTRTMEAESTVVYDDATAGLTLAWWARAKALPTRVLTYIAGYDRAWLERGDVVSITDAGLSMTDQLGLVESLLFREDGTIRIKVRIIEDVATQFKVT